MTDVRWDEPEWHATIDSTNLALQADPRPGRVVIADHQSAGQGRRGRSWVAPEGTALAISVALPAPAPAERPWVPLIGGLAVVRALGRVRWPVDAWLKWPNDVLAGSAPGPHGKICGVLAHAISHPAHGDVVVLGAGLNIDQGPGELATPQATSWRLIRGGAVLPSAARSEFASRYLSELALLLTTLRSDPAAVREAYRGACVTLRRQVMLLLPGDQRVSGTAVEVADDGALVIEGPLGRRKHHAGDVVHVRPDR